MDGIAKARDQAAGLATSPCPGRHQALSWSGAAGTVPEIIRRTGLSKASAYRAPVGSVQPMA
jgi:hypothetical protein